MGQINGKEFSVWIFRLGILDYLKTFQNRLTIYSSTEIRFFFVNGKHSKSQRKNGSRVLYFLSVFRLVSLLSIIQNFRQFYFPFDLCTSSHEKISW